MRTLHPIRHSQPHRRRGATLVETLIAISIFSTVSAFVIFVYILAARNEHRSLQAIPAEANTYRALDRMRQNILAAEINTVVVANDGAEITFRDGGRGRTSRYAFNEQSGKLTFIPDIGTTAEVELGRFDTCEFESRNFGRNIGVTLAVASRDSRGRTVPRTYTEWITVRN